MPKVIFNFKIDKTEKKTYVELCEENGLSHAQELRNFVKSRIKKLSNEK